MNVALIVTLTNWFLPANYKIDVQTFNLQYTVTSALTSQSVQSRKQLHAGKKLYKDSKGCTNFDKSPQVMAFGCLLGLNVLNLKMDKPWREVSLSL